MTTNLVFARLMVAAVLCCATATSGCMAAALSRPNIILCMADDQGWGDMGYNGHKILQTPNFDRMAKEGVRFDRFYAAAPVCSPTRGSVLTGRHPNRFGCFSWGYPLRPQEITLAEVLKGAGYATGHFGKWHLGSVFKGSPVNPGNSGFDTWLSAPNYYDNDPILSREGVAVLFQGESSMIAVEAALEFMDRQAAAGKPFLAVVWFGSPHAPHKASPEDAAGYPGLKPELQNFYGEITGMDRAFGRLREGVARRGLRENTLLWYCSDNGGLPTIGATGGRGNKSSLNEGGLRVPALLEWPARIKEPRVVTAPCSTVDIYPTVLEMTGAKAPRQPVLDGIDILPLIEGRVSCRPQPLGFWRIPVAALPPTQGREANSVKWMEELLQLQKAGREMQDPDRLVPDAGNLSRHYREDLFIGQSAWLDWPWKLHRIEKDSGRVEFQLYDLQADAMESQNRQQDSPDRLKAMRAQLEAWLQSVTRSLNGEDYEL